MQKDNLKRVIVDTNCWISYLIGKRLSFLTDLLANERIELIICDELLSELKEVTQRSKFVKYFPSSEIEKLLTYLREIGINIEFEENLHLCRDSADDWLLDLAVNSKADFLVTGDKDLLVLNNIGNCKIVDISTFEQCLFSFY